MRCVHGVLVRLLVGMRALLSDPLRSTFGDKALEAAVEQFKEAFAEATVGDMLDTYWACIKAGVVKGQLLHAMIERRKG